MNKRAFLTCGAIGAGWNFLPSRAGATNPRAFKSDPLMDHFPNVVLRTHEDRAVRFYDDLIKGKIVTLNFMYAGCADICPGMTYNLTRVQSSSARGSGATSSCIPSPWSRRRTPRRC